MHLFYVDESGSVSDPSQQYFVLAGVAVFERKTHWIEQNLNSIAARFDPVTPEPVVHAFEQISSRFDMFLRRLYTKHGDPQRGIMVFDKSSTEQRIQTLARDFKYSGHSWGTTQNYAEVPLFLDSRASRLIQLADLVAYAIFRHFEHKDSAFFDVIKDCFDAEGGVRHGLYIKV